MEKQVLGLNLHPVTEYRLSPYKSCGPAILEKAFRKEWRPMVFIGLFYFAIWMGLSDS